MYRHTVKAQVEEDLGQDPFYSLDFPAMEHKGEHVFPHVPIFPCSLRIVPSPYILTFVECDSHQNKITCQKEQMFEESYDQCSKQRLKGMAPSKSKGVRK